MYGIRQQCLYGLETVHLTYKIERELTRSSRKGRTCFRNGNIVLDPGTKRERQKNLNQGIWKSFLLCSSYFFNFLFLALILFCLLSLLCCHNFLRRLNFLKPDNLLYVYCLSYVQVIKSLILTFTVLMPCHCPIIGFVLQCTPMYKPFGYW